MISRIVLDSVVIHCSHVGTGEIAREELVEWPLQKKMVQLYKTRVANLNQIRLLSKYRSLIKLWLKKQHFLF